LEVIPSSTEESSLTISAKPVGVGAVFQPWILAGERSGLLTRTAAMENGSLRTQMKKLEQRFTQLQDD
jgi:hypothetical protein